MDNRRHDRPVPGAPDTTEDTVDGQRALRLHAGIAVIAIALCGFVAVVFTVLGSALLAVAFAVIGALCLAVGVRAGYRKRRGRRNTRSRGAAPERRGAR